MRALGAGLLVALLLLVPVAQAADDAPVTVSDLSVVPMTPTTAERIAIGQLVAGLKSENADLKASVKNQLPPLAIAGLIVLGIVLGGLGGYGIKAAIDAKPAPTPEPPVPTP